VPAVNKAECIEHKGIATIEENKMKARFKLSPIGLTGKIDDKIFYYHPRLQTILVRTYTKPNHNPSAERMQLIMANLKLIQPSAGYKRNLKDYLIQYNNLADADYKPVTCWVNLYLKLMFAMAKANPELDLTTLSRNQIQEHSRPCRSIKSSIEAGLLPLVRYYLKYTELI